MVFDLWKKRIFVLYLLANYQFLKSVQKNYWVKSGAFAFLQRLSIPLFGFGSYILLVRSLTLDEIGIWTLYISFATTVEMAREGLLKEALIKHFYDSNQQDKYYLIGASLRINLIFTLIAFLLTVGLYNAFHERIKIDGFLHLLIIYNVGLVLTTFQSHIQYILHAIMDFKAIFFGFFIKQGVLFILILNSFFIEVNLDLIALSIFHACGILFATLSNWLFIRKKPKRMQRITSFE